MKAATAIMGACALVVTFALAVSAGSARADAYQPLRDDPVIHQGLTAFSVGRLIHLRCPEISGRVLRTMTFLESLVDRAEDLGFTRSEIRAYIDNDADQERYRQIATDYFASRGAALDDPSGVCRVGRDEIAAGSPIGRLLRGG
ncbi:DUF5333 domain-containing protein [Roseibacterium sp. SDUM158017]|uniref:DUF5333 domain-containing protein n=1 Tax=Roseicyclus salinarum TaxID=3036773 RepID=UPI0024157D16|nr:DUF5333 domain-containing protein [Roseibacterium sp. SDUM158017]MDG4649086.1 DUF5333 domain-containing protein [Roseibacterium sp. SDUM158017]